MKLGAFAAVAAVVLTACGSTGTPSGNTSSPPPTANMKPQTSIGAGEGQLNLVLWDGYAEKSWADPFTAATGCKLNLHPAGSSDEMVSLMKDGGGGQWDMVSASGDADLRLIYAGDVRPMNVDLIPDWQNFDNYFKHPPYNTINDVHYGVSLQWGPNTLLYNTKKFPNKPTSWQVIYDPANKGLITVPDNPIQIADAALYLSRTQPSLGIKDPYELTQNQLTAAVDLLKRQRPLIKKYWSLASDEIDLFKNGDAVIGASWPYQTITLQGAKVPVKDEIPREGATGWADTWMLSAHARHPNCAYLWMKWVSTPRVQAEQAISFGETPANTKACPIMNQIQKGACAQYHANAPAAYFNSIHFWKTPTKDCPSQNNGCTDYNDWQRKWTEIKG